MKRIVVIEDSPTQAAVVRIALQRAGYSVEVCTDGAAGLEACTADVPALVLTDIVMPKLDGYQVIAALRNNPRTESIPILVMTNLEDPDHVLEAVHAGADSYLTKPLQPATVLERVQQQFAQPRARSRASVLEHVLTTCLGDATARQRDLLAKQAELEQAHAQRDATMRIVAHELRGPLQSLAMRAAAAKALPDRLDLLESLPRAIDEQVGTMVRIIDDLRELTELDLGHLRLDRRPTDLVELARSTTHELAGLNPGRAIELTAAPSDPVELDLDPTRIEQVLRNLITNAVKYTSGRIEVRVASPQLDAAEVRVVDEGEGLSETEAQTVFERYARGEAHRGQVRGTGLGLYLCRQIAELHGGTLDVDTQPGHGCAFWLRLPR